MHLVPFGEEQLREIGPILPANAGNESFFHLLRDSLS